MATLQCIVFFLACAFLLQEIQAQRSDYHYSESSSSSSSSESKNENFKKEVKFVNDKTNAVMLDACGVMRSLNLECHIGGMNRRFLGSFALDIGKRFVNFNILNALISALPPCTQQKLRVIQNLFRTALELITASLRTIYNFGKDVTRCVLSLGQCIKNIFDKVFQTVMNIIRNLISRVTEATARVFRLSKTCPVPPPDSNPDKIIIRFGTCFFCAFKPTARMCG